jgi:predicted transposase YdaD
MMSGALIETNARRLKNEAENETKKETALRMLQDGELSIDKIAMYTELKVEEVKKLAGLQTV